MKYRPDIDGLRAIAILPVVAFHAGINSIPGGFIGVDIFFVISGYLITKILLEEIKNNSFSILEFYKRRILRIMPALSAVILATVLAGYLLLLPNEFREIGQTVISTSLFVSNIFFWKQAGYFDGPAEQKPFLHTWSLAVEEQFYIIFPLILLLLWRFFGIRFIYFIIGTCLLSFALSVIITPLSHSSAFYLLPTRAWELGVGSLIAAGFFPKIEELRTRSIIVLFGLIAIIVSILAIQPGLDFPGWRAALPVLGAAAFILYTPGTFLNNTLSSKALTSIGKISYSLYLWHWPIIVYYRMIYGQELKFIDSVIVVLLSFAIATISYLYIEQPFRQKSFRVIPANVIVKFGSISLLTFVTLGLIIWHASSYLIKIPENVAIISNYSKYTETEEYRLQFRSGDCFLSSNTDDFLSFNHSKCLTISNEKPNYLVLGDSHGAHITHAIQLSFPDVNIMQATASGCKPVINTKGERRCTDLINYIYKDFILKHQLDGIIIAGRWKASGFDDLLESVEYLHKKGIPITVLGPVPEYHGQLSTLLAQSLYHQDPSIVQNAFVHSKSTIDRTYSNINGKYDVNYISIYDIMCPNGSCKTLLEANTPIQFDYGHLTLGGSIYVVRLLKSSHKLNLH